MEDIYAYEGPMWVYQEGFGDNAESKIAIRFEGSIEDGEVVEIQSQVNDGTIPAEYLPEVKQFAKKVNLGPDAKETIEEAESEAIGIALAESKARKDAKWEKIKGKSGERFTTDILMRDITANILELRDGSYALRPLGKDKKYVISKMLEQSREARPDKVGYLKRYSIIVGDTDLKVGITRFDQQQGLVRWTDEQKADRQEVLGEKGDKGYFGKYFLPEDHIKIVTGRLTVEGNGDMLSLEKAGELFVDELKYESDGYKNTKNKYSFPNLTTITDGLIVHGPVYAPKLETIYGNVYVSDKGQKKNYERELSTKKTDLEYWKRNPKGEELKKAKERGGGLRLSYWAEKKWDSKTEEMVDNWPPEDYHKGLFLDAPALRTATISEEAGGRFMYNKGWKIDGDTKINVPSLELIDGDLKLQGGNQVYPALSRVGGNFEANSKNLAKGKKPEIKGGKFDWTGTGFIFGKDSFPSLVTVDGLLRIEYPIKLPSLVSAEELIVHSTHVELKNLTAIRDMVELGHKTELPNLKYVGQMFETNSGSYFPSLVSVNGDIALFDGYIHPSIVSDDNQEFKTREKKDNFRILYRGTHQVLTPKRLAELNADHKNFPKLEKLKEQPSGNILERERNGCV